MAPSTPASLLKAADEAIARNEPREAIKIYKTFLSQHRSHPRALRVRSRIVTLHTRLGEYDEAVGVGERAGAGVEKDIDLLYSIAQAHMYSGNLKQAIASLERCLSIEPDHPASIARMAVVLMSQKRADEAMKTVEDAWARGIDTWDLDHVFAQLAPGAKREGEAIDRLRVRVEEPGLTPAARSGIAMGLATLLEKEGDFAGSWAAAVRANRLTRVGWNAELHRAGLDETRAVYCAEAFDAMRETIGSVARQDELVFVVGMPRSGTTLIDQVLSAHPGAESVGESRCLELAAAGVRLETPDARTLARLSAAKRSAAGAALRASMCAITGTDRVQIDKTPFNDRRVGALASIAPGARIILTRRDPRDTALSCYFRNFAGGMEWSADMAWITEIIRQRMVLHAHWLAVLPDHAPWVSITEARYETLVTEAEPEARRLVEFAGMPWDDACLRFSERKRMLPTLEPGQAGKGVYTGSVARWRRYEPYAEGAFDALHAIAEQLGYETA